MVRSVNHIMLKRSPSSFVPYCKHMPSYTFYETLNRYITRTVEFANKFWILKRKKMASGTEV